MGELRAVVLTAILACLAAACDPSASMIQVLDRPAAEVVVGVSAGTTPTYTWTGGNGRALVVQSVSGEVVWRVEALDPRVGFAPPVHHGIVPVSGREATAPRILEAGVLHTVTVTTVAGVRGTRTFTPSGAPSP